MKHKDPLDYTEQELNELSTEELKILKDSAELLEGTFNTEQTVAKLSINSLYGALANKYFTLFNESIACAITGNGRYFIRKLANYIEDELQKLYKSPKEYIIYGDTDSCVGSTVIKTSNGDIPIEDLYDKLNGDVEVRGTDNFIKHVNTKIQAGSVSGDLEYQEKPIKYVMKHKVKKRMFKVTDNSLQLEQSVQITEDHSIMILRDNKLVQVKVSDIIKGDLLISEDNEQLVLSNVFKIEDLGVQEEWVYDIEVEDNHNFFGNNILLHNSIYFSIEPFMDHYQSKNPGLEINEYVDWADNFEKKVIQPIIQKCITDFAKELNAYNAEAIGAEREIIADCAVFTEKKKYYARVRDSEGTRYPQDDPYIKVMGLDIIKSTTPIWSKKYLKEAIPIILDNNESDIRDWIVSIKQEFIQVPLSSIAQVGGVSNLDYVLGTKGVPQGARSALIHNKYIKDNNLEDRIAPINPGDKCKKLFLTEPNKLGTNVVSYTNDTFTNELSGIIDYDTQFQKGFLKPLELMTNCLGYNLEKETEELDSW